jgi:hypothetical protein
MKTKTPTFAATIALALAATTAAQAEFSGAPQVLKAVQKRFPKATAIEQIGDESVTFKLGDQPWMCGLNRSMRLMNCRVTGATPPFDPPGASFTIPRGTAMCDEPGDDKGPGKACNTAKQVWTVKLWGEPREGWCLIVHWIDSGKPGYKLAAWKAWVDCKDLSDE